MQWRQIEGEGSRQRFSTDFYKLPRRVSACNRKWYLFLEETVNGCCYGLGKLKIGLSTGEDEGGFSDKVHCVLRDTHAVSYLTRDTITHTIALTQKLINTHTGSKQQEVSWLVMFMDSRCHVMLFFLLIADPRKSTLLDIRTTRLTSHTVCVVCVFWVWRSTYFYSVLC